MRYSTRGISVRRTPVGRGIFATQSFKKDQVVGQMRGTIVTTDEYDPDYAVDLGKLGVLDPWVPFRYLNHSCEPNAQLVMHPARRGSPPTLWVEALRTIRAGDQITIDYAWPADSAIRCLCGAKTCRGWVVAASHARALTAKANREARAKAAREGRASVTRSSQARTAEARTAGARSTSAASKSAGSKATGNKAAGSKAAEAATTRDTRSTQAEARDSQPRSTRDSQPRSTRESRPPASKANGTAASKTNGTAASKTNGTAAQREARSGGGKSRSKLRAEVALSL